jgi:hypothetical protein
MAIFKDLLPANRDRRGDNSSERDDFSGRGRHGRHGSGHGGHRHDHDHGSGHDHGY